MAIFEINNFTRYNTEDLIAIFDAIESRLTTVEPGGVHTYKRKVDVQISSTATFKDYKPSQHFKLHRRWDNSQGRMVSVRIRQHIKASARWRDPDIRLVPPEMIHLDPLSALAAAEENTIPGEMLTALVTRIASLYDGVDNLAEIVAACPVRILPKRARTVGAAEKHRVARAAARKAWSSGNYALCQINRYTEDFTRAHDKAFSRLKRSKVIPNERELAISTAFEQFQAAHNDLLTVLAAACKDDE